MKRLAVLVVCLVALACGNDSPPTGGPNGPSPAMNLTGSWTGTVTSVSRAAIVGPGTIRVTMSQSTLALTGTWSASYANAANNNSGPLAGNVNGLAVSFTLTSSVPTQCPLMATGIINDATHISGTYATVNCTVSDSGPFSMTKS